MFKHLIVLVVMLAFANVNAAQLLNIKNDELTSVLNGITQFNPVKEFTEQGFSVRSYKVSSTNCDPINCKTLETIYLATTESPGEGAVESVYKTPQMHKWEIGEWKLSSSNIWVLNLESKSTPGSTPVKWELRVTAYKAMLVTL